MDNPIPLNRNSYVELPTGVRVTAPLAAQSEPGLAPLSQTPAGYYGSPLSQVGQPHPMAVHPVQQEDEEDEEETTAEGEDMEDDEDEEEEPSEMEDEEEEEEEAA
jgi:hypothetical protein